MIDTITALERARVTLLDPDEPFDFMSWERCTCGHIFKAVTGDAPRAVTAGLFTDWGFAYVPEYTKVIRETAMALGWDGRTTNDDLTLEEHALAVISARTSRLANSVHGDGAREAAVIVIDEALDALRHPRTRAAAEVLYEHAVAYVEGRSAEMVPA